VEEDGRKSGNIIRNSHGHPSNRGIEASNSFLPDAHKGQASNMRGEGGIEIWQGGDLLGGASLEAQRRRP